MSRRIYQKDRSLIVNRLEEVGINVVVDNTMGRKRIYTPRGQSRRIHLEWSGGCWGGEHYPGIRSSIHTESDLEEAIRHLKTAKEPTDDEDELIGEMLFHRASMEDHACEAAERIDICICILAGCMQDDYGEIPDRADDLWDSASSLADDLETAAALLRAHEVS